MRIKISLFFLCALLFIWSTSLKAQWTTTPDSTLQISPWGVNIDACTDSNSGCYIAFTNFSYVKTRYYLQKVNKFGYNEWPNPVMIGDTANLCVRARLTPVNNFSGVVAAYYARSVKETIQARIIYTGKLFLQKIDDSGKLLWGTNGVRASVDTFNQDGFGYPTVIPDDSGGVFVMWVDKRHDGTDVRGSLNVQRISPDGKRLWGDYGIQVIDTLGNNTPVLEKTINGVAILFVNKTESKLTKVDYNSNPVWTTILSSDNSTGFSQITSDNLGNIYLGGRKNVDNSSLLTSLILRKINTDGQNGWGNDITIIDSISNMSRLHELHRTESNPFYISYSWNEVVGLITPEYGKGKIQILNAQGVKILTPNQTDVTTNDTSSNIQYVIVADSSSFILLFSDTRSGEQLYYGQKISLNGKKQWNASDVLLTTYKADNNQIVIRDVITDSQGGIIAIGSIEPHWGIYGIQINKNGVLGSVITKVNDFNNLSPNRFELFQNYPNPFNPSTEIRYQISEFSRVVLKVYDMLGREAVILVNENIQPGNYTMHWNASGLASGVYFYRLQALNHVITKRMILMK